MLQREGAAASKLLCLFVAMILEILLVQFETGDISLNVAFNAS